MSTSAPNSTASVDHSIEFIQRIRERIATVVVGQDVVVDRMLIALFTVHVLLKDIEANNGFNTKRKAELSTSINRIEKYYFGEANGAEEPKLNEIASSWVRRAK